MRSLHQIVFLLLLLTSFGMDTSANPLDPSLAREVALVSPQGDTLRLSDLRGKVVLVDFWASWCGPCRVSNRSLAGLYERYHDRGFEIFGISVDNDKSRWKAAIAADRINWLQVNQFGGWDAPVALEWNIDKLPSSFLIDQAGKIIAVDPSYGVIKSWLDQLLTTQNQPK